MAGFLYRVSRSNIAASTTVSSLNIIPAAARHLRIWRIALVGMGTASLAQELLMSRINAVGTGALTAITPRPLDLSSPAAAFTCGAPYATTEATLTSDILRCPFNNNGGVYIWQARNDREVIEVQPNTNGVTLRGSISTGVFSFELDAEEL
jgi:hypothetical protein